MTIPATWANRIRIALALLILTPTLVLATSHAQADAASWKTMASGWSSGASPWVQLSGESKAKPTAMRIQVTNGAKKAREIDVTWFRTCELKSGRLSFASGDFVKKIGKGKTHTKSIGVPKNAVSCELTAWADAWSYNEPGVKGKLTIKLQSS